MSNRGELKPLRQRMGDIQSAAAGFPADGYDQLMGHRKDLTYKMVGSSTQRGVQPRLMQQIEQQRVTAYNGQPPAGEYPAGAGISTAAVGRDRTRSRTEEPRQQGERV